MNETPPAVENRGHPGGQDGVVPTSLRATEAVTSTVTKQTVLIDQLINWMMANPGKPMTLAATTLGLSAAWLRMVASSDAFRARLSEKQEGFDTALMIPKLSEKLRATADLAVEKLNHQLEISGDPQFILDSTEMLLKTQGAAVGIKAPDPQQTFNVDNLTLVIAQQRSALLAAPQMKQIEAAPAAGD